MKNLANCKPAEFLVQTNKIRKAVSKWLKDTNVLEIRKRQPANLVEITDTMTDEEKETAQNANEIATREQTHQNLSDMLDAALESNPQETMNLIAMICFVDPEHVDEYKPTAYLKEIAQVLADEDVIDFFMSLMRLESAGILNTVAK